MMYADRSEYLKSRYSYIREGYIPVPLTWHKVEDCRPIMEEDLGGILRSRCVLLSARGYMLVGYLQQYDDNEFPEQWKLAGRDGYIAADVTHWRWLPRPPTDW